jgi:SAM-dependent methyltransferase
MQPSSTPPAPHIRRGFIVPSGFANPYVCHPSAIFIVKLALVDKTRLTGRPDHPRSV